ncbi:hypothetical protein C1646_749297 [Rhizophagus diaphanus]|nr:hypothetical protein C1646_749297 [Rhizophagus diaphanus] [Rhizophagus sp. MUCL 43196]
MPKNSNKCAQTANLSETATFHECADFFKKFGKVKNTKFATKNWVISLKKFHKEVGFIGKIDEIATEAELDQQLSEYIAIIRQQNGQEYSASSVQAAIVKVFNRKIKYLSDFGLNELKGSDALTKLMKEICIMIEINLNNRKIMNHAGRKTMVQALQYLGQDTDCIRHQSQHKSDQRLQSYVLPHNQQQLDMMTSLVNEIHKKTSSNNISPINLTDINKEQVNRTFLTVKKSIILLLNNNCIRKFA